MTEANQRKLLFLIMKVNQRQLLFLDNTYYLV